MKNKTIILNIFIVTLIITAPFNTVFANYFLPVNDTIPEESAKTSNPQEESSDEFSEMEKELKALDSDWKESDTTKIRIGKMKIEVIDDGNDVTINKDSDWEDDDDWDKDWGWNDDSWSFHKRDKNKFKPHWASFAMGLNNYVTVDDKTTLPAEWQLLEVNTNTSYEVNVNFAQKGVNLIKNRVGLVTGMGFKWNNYKFRNPDTYLDNKSGVLTVSVDSGYNGKISKLTTCYFIVPLLLEVQIPSGREEFYLNAGVETGLKLSSYTKRENNDDKKSKDHSDFFTASLDFRLTARAGYGDFGVFASYGLVPLFDTDKAIELYPVAVGVSLNF